MYSISNPIHKQTIENQECRMNLDGVKPVEGYMVSFRSKEHKINVLDFNVGHVDSFIRSNLDLLHNRNCFVGTWIDNDIVYIDISLNISDKDQALIWGKANGQICIWDVKKKVEIYQLEEV
ncbi:MAG TPA: hypothetical protein VFD03_03740 [Clostridia bacterium]|nr:hypothetical protein [Clostridia bacterium]